MSIRRTCRFPAGSCPAFILSVTMLAVILAGTPGAGAAPARPGQMATRAHLPHLVSAGYSPTLPIGLLHDAGAIATARTGDQVNPERASSGSQFYICLEPIHQLDGGYTVFGYVVEGLEVAQQIAVGDTILSVEITEQ